MQLQTYIRPTTAPSTSTETESTRKNGSSTGGVPPEIQTRDFLIQKLYGLRQFTCYTAMSYLQNF